MLVGVVCILRMVKSMDKRYILVDADMVVYRACSSCETEIDWGNDIFTLHVDFNEALAYFMNQMDRWIERALELDQFVGQVEPIYAFSSSEKLFRKDILATYKLNRVGKRKPLAYHALCKWVSEHCKAIKIKHLEADDVIGLLATGAYEDNSIILSADKDMQSIPTKFYNFLKDELSETTKEDAVYWHLYQTLVGDVADNYTGCPKVGDKTARKLLDEKGVSWETVVGAYSHAGLSEEEALRQAQVAYILQHGDYNKKTGKVKLWTPKVLDQ